MKRKVWLVALTFVLAPVFVSAQTLAVNLAPTPVQQKAELKKQNTINRQDKNAQKEEGRKAQYGPADIGPDGQPRIVPLKK